jgi:hypothetical protein
MQVLHKRVGEVRKPEEIVTIDVLHAMDKRLEGEWTVEKTQADQRHICELGAWVIGGFCMGLQGEEML